MLQEMWLSAVLMSRAVSAGHGAKLSRKTASCCSQRCLWLSTLRATGRRGGVMHRQDVEGGAAPPSSAARTETGSSRKNCHAERQLSYSVRFGSGQGIGSSRSPADVAWRRRSLTDSCSMPVALMRLRKRLLASLSCWQERSSRS